MAGYDGTANFEAQKAKLNIKLNEKRDTRKSQEESILLPTNDEEKAMN